MIKTAKTSITAIIFVTIYFLFIIFISLFKGITLYDIKIHNTLIKKIFIKIDKKITLKIYNININTDNNYKEAVKLHDFFFYSTKILPIFKKIIIKNIYKNNFLIINKAILNKHRLILLTPTFYAKGTFKILKNYSNVTFDIIKFKQYKFINTHIFSYYTKKFVFSNIKTFYNNHPLYIALKADNNYINYSIKANKFKINYKNFINFVNNLTINGKINTYFTYFYAKFNADNLNIINKNLNINASYIKGNFKNNILNLNYKYAKIKYPIYFNNLTLNNSLSTFNINTRDLIHYSKKITLKYKKYLLKADNITLNYNIKNKNMFLHLLNLKLNNDINATTKEVIISMLPNLYFYLKNNHTTYKYFNLSNKLITGNKKLVILDDIIGKIIGFNTKISSPKIDLNKKIAISKNIYFNHIKLNKTSFNFSKKPYILTTSTNTLFNKNVKEILQKFNISIPFTQIKGKNKLKFEFLISNKLNNIFYDINFSNSYFKSNDYNFSFTKLYAKGDLNFSKIELKNFIFPYKYLDTQFDSNITINLFKYINSYTFFKYLNIDHFLNIKNFNEKIVIDLKKKFIYCLNSAIFANLNNNTIYFYSLKNLLKYSIFNEIFKNGEVIIKLLKKEIDFYINALLNYPLLLNEANPNMINATITLKNNNIHIYNNNIDTKIINFNKINSTISNLDIDIEGLIKIINTTEKILNKITSKTNKNNNFEAKITALNTNFIYKKYKFLTKKATLNFNKEINFSATYNKSHLYGYTKNNFLLIEGKNYNKKALVPLLSFFNHFSYINLDFITIRSPQNFYTGKIYIKKGAIKDLGALNNIIAFINTIPALLTLNNPGFSAKGYKIKKGYINYLFYKNILYFKQIKIKGINIDFDGKGYIDLNKNLIKMKIDTTIKIKLKKIPIIGKGLSYLFFGKDGYLHVNIFVKGNLDNPKIKKDIEGGIIESPLKLFKRILTLPFNIF